MRLAPFSAVLTILLASTAAAESVTPDRPLTVVLDFRGVYSAPTVTAMERETERILGSAGIHLEWRTKGASPIETSGALVLVRFNGRCRLEPVGYLFDERGPLAFTYATDGQVQPFSEVACDQVVSSVRLGMLPGDYSHADQFFGRALGRVVAHELVHILTGESTHAKEGVTRRGLSPDRLVAPTLNLQPEDIQRIRSSLQSAR